MLTIYLSSPLQKGETLQINLQYAGKIGVVSQYEINRITEEWIELGMYTPWFPYQPEIEKLTYQVDVKIDQEYQVIGMGKTEKMADHWRISSGKPTTDIIIMAAKEIHTEDTQKDGLRMDVNYIAMRESTAVDIAEQGLWMLLNYRKWFGDIKVHQASIIIAPRSMGGGYGRRGFIVLTPFADADYYENRIGYFQYIGHEFSHLWWSNAPCDSWEDWLNESFAEYSALMAVRERFGNDSFKEQMRAKQKTAKGLPAIRGIDRMDENIHTVLYDKGCVLLHELESEIGNANFLQLLNQLTENKASSTDQFTGILTGLFGAEVSKKFEGKLDM